MTAQAARTLLEVAGWLAALVVGFGWAVHALGR